MRILFITEGFNPEPTFKGLSFAKELVKLGHEVQVLTGFPNYPGGKVYPGYKIKPWQREVMEGIPILRVALYPSHDQSPIKRVLTYGSFALSAALLGVFLVKSADIVYVYQPPATIALPGIVVGKLRGKRIVYDIQDMWPDTLSSTGMVNSSRILRLVGLWCKANYKLVNHITVLSNGFKRLLIERGVPAEKIDVIRNWADASSEIKFPQDPSFAKKLGFEGKFNIVFAGTMGKAQALDSVLEAAKILQPRNDRIQFVFIGGGIERKNLEERSHQMNLKNILFMERVPLEEIGKILSQADALLVHLKDDPLFEVTIPSKTQGYLAIGKPIIMAVHGEAAEIVAEANAGVICKPQDPESLVKGVETLYSLPRESLDAMGERGRKYYDENLSLAIGAKKFEKLFSTLLRKK